jgi:hypothetical protein
MSGSSGTPDPPPPWMADAGQAARGPAGTSSADCPSCACRWAADPPAGKRPRRTPDHSPCPRLTRPSQLGVMQAMCISSVHLCCAYVLCICPPAGVVSPLPRSSPRLIEEYSAPDPAGAFRVGPRRRVGCRSPPSRSCSGRVGGAPRGQGCGCSAGVATPSVSVQIRVSCARSFGDLRGTTGNNNQNFTDRVGKTTDPGAGD